ncbi:14834_t:CDS:2 [Funneliformis caledonium]|uniref:14834_t:CDS:1 n=1 Tax=Funneliformis caledonium TaxID=1117310 RepID=A0A9N9C6L6_9GLOM|nr:14834_t:CDS:2 [Funneliformis caledonium]
MSNAYLLKITLFLQRELFTSKACILQVLYCEKVIHVINKIVSIKNVETEVATSSKNKGKEVSIFPRELSIENIESTEIALTTKDKEIISTLLNVKKFMK